MNEIMNDMEKLKPGENVFLEMTNEIHGGNGWDLYTCLWSPEESTNNRDCWKTMREPEENDYVIHSVKNNKGHMIEGYSRVTINKTPKTITILSKPTKACILTNTEPPVPERWAGYGSYYRIELKDYTPLHEPLLLQDFLDEYNHVFCQIEGSFFTKDVIPAQKYLTNLDAFTRDLLIKYINCF